MREIASDLDEPQAVSGIKQIEADIGLAVAQEWEERTRIAELWE